ncbi:MAG: hypothetical protein KC586_25705 [Myxococcales bacterium]|nr:hypothetical protein [Myxococcales bacterium]
MRRSLRVFLGLALAVAGCGQDPVRVQPPTFDRPASAVFLCARRQAGVDGYTGLAPLSECATDASGVRDTDALDADTHALLSLVTQTARGEVAAVDLRVDRVLDADGFIPGYTFHRVDETPTGIALDPEVPDVFHVASFAAQRIRSYATGEVLDFAEGEFTPVDASVQLSDGPVDLVFAQPGTPTLYAALPRTGQIAVVRAPTGPVDPTTLEEIDLDPTVPEQVAPPATIAPWEKICPAATLRAPQAGALAAAVSLGTDPQPVRLRVVDERELLVADASLPLVHRYAIAADGALTALAPIATGVPVRDIAVSPVVPATFGGAATETARYLYAIDATDEGSVLVVDYLEGSATFGAVLPVHVGDGRADRVRLPGPASTVEVLTPGFDDTTACTADDSSPLAMRGVFLAVGLSTGLVSIVDVLDLDANCRGGVACAAESRPDNDDFLYLRRHVTRSASRLPTEPIALSGGVSLFFEGAPARLDENGQTPAGEAAPSLAVIPCTAPMTSIFGEMPRLCSISEPWAARAETWTATFEGEIPNAASFRARVDRTVDAGAGRVTVAAPTSALCNRGVLGAEDVGRSGLTEGDPESGYLGDVLVVTSDPPSSTASLPECAGFVASDAGERDADRFAILAASAESVVLADDAAFQLFERCYPSLFSFEVQVRGAFAVVGSRSGFAHRVIADAETRCVVDVAGQPVDATNPTTFRNGRAFVGRSYQNPFVAFQLQAPNGLELTSGLEVELQFLITQVPTPLSIDVGARSNGRIPTIIESIRYSPAEERLYVLDSNGNGFSKYDLQPLQRLALID